VRHFDIAKDTKQSIFKNVFYLSLRIHGRDSIRCQPWHLMKEASAEVYINRMQQHMGQMGASKSLKKGAHHRKMSFPSTLRNQTASS